MSRKKSSDVIKTNKILDDSYKTVHIDGVYCMRNESFGQLLPYYDEPVLEFDRDGHVEVTSINRHFIIDLRMSPNTFDKIAKQLDSSKEIDNIEKIENVDEESQ